MDRIPYVIITGAAAACAMIALTLLGLLHQSVFEAIATALIVGAAAALGGALYLRRHDLPIGATYGQYSAAKHSPR